MTQDKGAVGVNRISTILLVALLFIGQLGAGIQAIMAEPRNAAGYPPVGYLQDKLPVHPGDPLGRLIDWPPGSGRLLQPRYLSGRYDGDGVYTVKLKLDER